MREKLIALIQLQDCDNRIRSIIRKRDEGPVKIQKLEEELKTSRLKYQEEFNLLESLKKERRTLEQDVQEIENRIVKSQGKLNNIKSNKEYTAALKEIEMLSKEKSVLEDKEIQIMERLEGLEQKSLQYSKEQEELARKFELDRIEIGNRMETLEKESKALQEKRKEYTDAADKELLNRYQFLKDRMGGISISPVIEGICQICHIRIPPQQFNDLRKGKEMQTCPNCYRIIYWGEDEYFEKNLVK